MYIVNIILNTMYMGLYCACYFEKLFWGGEKAQLLIIYENFGLFLSGLNFGCCV